MFFEKSLKPTLPSKHDTRKGLPPHSEHRRGHDGTGQANWSVAASAQPGLSTPQSGFSTFLTMSHDTRDTGLKASLPSSVDPIITTQIRDRKNGFLFVHKFNSDAQNFFHFPLNTTKGLN